MANSAPEFQTCPHCGQPTSALKQLRVPYRFICLVVYIRIYERIEQGCPTCMRAILSRAIWSNVLSANLAWPAMLLLFIPRYRATRTDGPTQVRPVTNPFFQDVTAQPAPGSTARMLGIGLIVTAAICGLFMALSGGSNDPLRPGGWLCFAVSIMGLLAFLAFTPKAKRPKK